VLIVINMKTTVHINACKTLAVLPHYIERRFGTWSTPGAHGACLLMQLAAVYQRSLGVSANKIQQALDRHLAMQYYGDAGNSLDVTIKAFESLSPWKLTGCVEHNLYTMVGTILRGVPVMLVVDSAFISDDTIRGSADVMHVNPSDDQLSMNTGYNHALMVIGYDYENDVVIVRESRSRYTRYRGLIKIRVADLTKWRSGWRMIELIFTKETPQ
jgi:hypothetical protein